MMCSAEEGCLRAKEKLADLERRLAVIEARTDLRAAHAVEDLREIKVYEAGRAVGRGTSWLRK